MAKKKIDIEAKKKIDIDTRQPRNLSVSDFRCCFCNQKKHHMEMSWRVRKACCKDCLPNVPAELVVTW